MKVLRNIKNVLKIILIVLLVVGVIVGTCFLFFHFLRREENSYANVSQYVYSSERGELKSRIDFVESKQAIEDNKQRFTIATQADQTLNEIAQSIIPYMNSYSLNNRTIMSKYRTMLSNQADLVSELTIFEYNTGDIKFDADVRGNRIITMYGRYLSSYAEMLREINSQISANVPNTNVNILFYIDDLYFHVVQVAVENLKDVNSYIQFQNQNELDAFEQFRLDGSFKNYVNLDIKANYFIEAYNNLDKQAFAKNLKQRLDAAKSITDSSSNEDKAAFYLKSILTPNAEV